jgi:hypothetical protein
MPAGAPVSRGQRRSQEKAARRSPGRRWLIGLIVLVVAAGAVVWAGPRVSHLTQVAVNGLAGNGTSSASSSGRAAAAATVAGLTATDLDAPAVWPMPDRMVFNTIKFPADSHEAVHDTSAMRLANSTKHPIKVTALEVTGPYALVSPPKLPLSLKPRAHLDVTVRFTADSGGAEGSVETGTLKVATKASGAKSSTIALEGWWQNLSEHNLEPSVADLKSMFGLNVTLPARFYTRGEVKAFSSDEVLSPYWRRLDPSAPVRVDELASWFHYGVESKLTWFAQGSTTQDPWATTGAFQSQTVLPQTASASSPGALSAGAITPSGAFGFHIDNQSSDPTQNSQTADRAAGCKSTTCGNYVRAFQLHAADGSVLKGSYLIVEDDGGAQPNYDYNDHVYILSNVQPA